MTRKASHCADLKQQKPPLPLARAARDRLKSTGSSRGHVPLRVCQPVCPSHNRRIEETDSECCRGSSESAAAAATQSAVPGSACESVLPARA